MTKQRVLGATAALATVGALAATGVGPAGAQPSAAKAKAATITMEQQGKKLSFEGPETVESGQQLKIKNLTDPEKVGPHTFSLVRKADLPETKPEIKECEKELVDICGAIAFDWHKLDPQTFEVGENPVDVGKDGWDRLGSLKREGDSWYTDRESQGFKREVTAPEGKKLFFICAVHAGMQGKVKVDG